MRPFQIGESDATFNEERRRNWGGAGNYISSGARGVASGGRRYVGGGNVFTGSGGGSSVGARAVASAGAPYVSHGNVFSGSGGGGGGGGGAAAAAAAAHAAAVAAQQARSSAALGVLGIGSGQPGSDPKMAVLQSLMHAGNPFGALAGILGASKGTSLSAITKSAQQGQHDAAKLAQASAAEKQVQKLMSGPGNANKAAAALKTPGFPSQVPGPPQPASKGSIAAVLGTAAGQNAPPIVYAASLPKAQQQKLAQRTTQGAARDALFKAYNQTANQAATAIQAGQAKGQAQLHQAIVNDPNILNHPSGSSFWGQPNMKRFQPGKSLGSTPKRAPSPGMPPSTLSPASASPVSALTNLFGGGSKPNFKAIGAAVGQAAKPASVAQPGATHANAQLAQKVAGVNARIQQTATGGQMASTRTSALKALNTAAGKQVAATKDPGLNALGRIFGSNANTIPSLVPLANLAGGGHLGDRARIAAHPGGATPGKSAYTPQQIARGDQSSGYALAIAKKLGANPMQQQALLIAATANPKTLGNTILRPQHTKQAFQSQLHAISDFVSKAKQTHASDPVHLAQQVSGFGATSRYQANAQYLAKSMPARLAQAERLASNVHGLNQALSQTQQGAPGLAGNLKDLFVAAGKKYGIDPAVLFGIASNETGDKTKGTVFQNPSTSSAGAVGWMQFMPATWAQYGVKAPGGKGAPDPHNVADAVYSAANYLKNGGHYQQGNPAAVRAAIFNYNHSQAYVNDVLNTSKLWRGGAGVAGQSFPSSGASGVSSGVGSAPGSGSSSTSSGASAGSSAGSAAGSVASQASQASQAASDQQARALQVASSLLGSTSHNRLAQLTPVTLKLGKVKGKSKPLTPVK